MKIIGKLLKALMLVIGALILIPSAIAVLVPPSDASRATSDSSEAEDASRSCQHCIYGQSDSSAVWTAHEMIKRQLRDPESAIWDGQRSWTDKPAVVVARTADGGIRAICGMVNAKNGFGDYSGDQVYIVSLELNFQKVGASDEEFKAACL